MAKKQMFRRVSRAELVFKRLQASEPQKTYAGLLWVCRDRDRKPGWASHKFKAIYGDWPKFKDRPEPEPPSSDLATWLERERRNYGARMKREDAKAEEQRKLTASQSAALLSRLEAILADLEANPLVRDPNYRQETDGEALDIVSKIERKMARNCAVRAKMLEVPGGSELNPQAGFGLGDQQS